jgi:hypothetical protein
MFIFLHSSHSDSVICSEIARASQSPHHRNQHKFFCIEVKMWHSHRRKIMTLIYSELPVFTKMSIHPVFQILGDDRWEFRSLSIVHICPSAIKRMMQIKHIPLVHDTFPTEDGAKDLMTALDPRKSLVNNLHGRCAQIVLTLKMTLIDVMTVMQICILCLLDFLVTSECHRKAPIAWFLC